LLTYPEADLSLWHLVFYFQISIMKYSTLVVTSCHQRIKNKSPFLLIKIWAASSWACS